MNSRAACVMNSMATASFHASLWAGVVMVDVAKQDLTPKFSKFSKLMIEDAVERTKVGTCFVAGTLVHTQAGLVPIEQIKVGDYVLSKPESGEGELSYQKVTKTFVHENQPILCVVVYPERLCIEAEASNSLIDTSQYSPLLVTPNHPFWVKGKGWVEANKLHIGVDMLSLSDGTLAILHDVSTVMRMDDPNLGWLIDGIFCPIRFTDVDSSWVDLSNNLIQLHWDFADKIENEAIEWWEKNPEDRLLRTVYNIEVENTHTYFVGTDGVWVHNKNAALCGEVLDVALAEARNNILPPYGTRAYFTEGEARKQFTQRA